MIELSGVALKGEIGDRLVGCQLAVRAGEVLGVIGPTGSGKTSLLRVCAGRVSVTRGQIRMDGRDVTRQHERLRTAAGYLDSQIPGPSDLTTAEWLNFWADLGDVSAETRRDTIQAMSTRFGAPLGTRSLSLCSTGELKRLNLARVWMGSPRFFVLDEASAGLDGDGLGRLSAAIEDASSAGTTVILSDSSPHLPVSVCDRVVIMKDGDVSAEISRTDPRFESMIAAAQGWAQ